VEFKELLKCNAVQGVHLSSGGLFLFRFALELATWYLSVDYGNFERARLDEILALLVDVPPTPCGAANLIERE
jgi:hypothetical protein